MSVDRGFVEENRQARDRLAGLVGRLSDAELARPLPAGWTGAAVLAHVAFWDQRILVLLEQSQKPGARASSRIHEADVDWINDSAKALCLALPPRRAAELAVAVAAAVDGRIEALSDDFVTRNAATDPPINLHRAEHRRQHLDEIEAALR